MFLVQLNFCNGRRGLIMASDFPVDEHTFICTNIDNKDILKVVKKLQTEESSLKDASCFT